MGDAASSLTATRVLVVDDDESQREGLASMVKAWGFEVQTAANGQEALEAVAAAEIHVIVTDMMMPRMDGNELLRRLAALGPMPPVIMLTGFGSVEAAIQAIHELGAYWFLEKPIQPSVLRLLVERAAAQRQLADETERLQRQLAYQGMLADLVGASEPMQQVFSLIRQVAPSRAAVLISGESGTGKELVARAIHRLSPRASGPFVAINCAALPETLMESELFGHERGAFTGAVERRSGCFELARNGTLLLDELGEMPVATQAKLLRVLEDSKVRRLGGKQETPVDVRIIASTNRDIPGILRRGELREDLFYRLNVFNIELPPLRDRLDDIPLLVEALIGVMNRKNQCRVTEARPELLAAFARHLWPGNVRELRNVVERAVILASEGAIGLDHLPLHFGAAPRPDAAASPSGAVQLAVGSTTVDQAERQLILRTMQHTRNNKTRAAEILGISLKTLFNKLKEYGTPSTAAEE